MSVSSRKAQLSASGLRLSVTLGGGNGTGGGGVGGIGQPSAVSHGEQITASNTGYTSYYDNALGRTLQQSDLQTINGNIRISDIVASGGTVNKKHFTGGIAVDLNNVTFNGCLFDNPVANSIGATHYYGTQFNWCTISPATAGDLCISHQSYSTYRCYFRGCSDGLRLNGGVTTQNIIECYIRVRMQSGDDHNDTLQSVGGEGTVIVQRCNLSVVPEGGVIAGGTGGPDSVMLSGSLASSSSFNFSMIDCLVDGTGCYYTQRPCDGALSSNILYTFTGNKHARPGGIASESTRGSANITPTNQVTWSNNTWQDNGSTIALS